MSLDALRGFDMFWIIGGDAIFAALRNIQKTGPVATFALQFEHVPWEGFVFYDLIFPLFIFIIGASLVFSLGRILASEGKWAAHKRLLRRFVLLFLLGIFYDEGVANLHRENILCGVLQRLALCYFLGGLLFIHLKPRGLVVSFVLLLAGYWAVLSFVPVPGAHEISFEPDKNWPHYIDRHVGPYYDTDPEGWLSTFPAVGSCLLGIFAAFLLKDARWRERQKVYLLLGAGAAMLTIGYLWGLPWGPEWRSQWGLQFPIIKRLWTSTYVLVAGGYSCVLLGVFYLIVDVWGFRAWTRPLLWIGMNPLTVYMADNTINFRGIAQRFVGGDIAGFFGPYADLVTTMVSLLLCILIARFLYQKKIFLRV